MKYIINTYILIFLFCTTSSAQFSPPKNTQKSNTINQVEVKSDDIIKKTKNCITYNGLFTIYQDKDDSQTYLEIDKEQLNQEYIYFSYLENGVGDAGMVRGRFRGSKVIRIKKFFNKIDFVIENNSYYFDEDSPLSKSSKANINEPIVISEKIIAMNSDSTKFLINADNVFLTESFQQIKYSYPSGFKGFKLGALSKDKTRYNSINNYPSNTDVIVDYTYETKYPTKRGGVAVTDSRIISIKIQHSLIAMPNNDYNPRYDDPRVGYFHTQTNNMTTIDQINYRDMIHRWDLKKKNPNQDLSEPVDPIVWWIENTTPIEFRNIIKTGVESWNQAFEKAGFINAIEVKIQSDTASWNAGDIRYNVLRWTSSPNPPWGGYGPSFVNPKTGQIIGADIMLEWVYITNRIKYDYLYDSNQDVGWNQNDPHVCLAANEFQKQNHFGTNCIDFLELGQEMKKDMIEQSLYRLVLHEVGHTLGLNHNFKGSTLLSNEEIKDPKVVYDKGLCSSVMEYPAINISTDPNNQSLFYDTKPGPYDHWAIEFGYSVFVDSLESYALDSVLFKSTQSNLAFANDADDMRSPGKGIDPNAMINDLTSDPILHSIEKMDMITAMLPNLKNRYSIEGESYERLRQSYYSLIGSYFTCLDIISRQIGGVYVDRSFVGQDTDKQPFQPVPFDLQNNAMDALAKYAFSDDKLLHIQDLYPYLQAQRRGFDFRSSGEDPKILGSILFKQQKLLAQLLNKNVLTRISNSSLYGNTYSLTQYMIDLRKAIFMKDMYSSVSQLRQNLQIYYLEKLLNIVSDNSRYDNLAQSSSYYNIDWLKDNLDVNTGDLSSRQHKEYLLYLISKIDKD